LNWIGSDISAAKPPTLKNIYFLKFPVHDDFENVLNVFLAAKVAEILETIYYFFSG
jgi:hypothetical protein